MNKIGEVSNQQHHAHPLVLCDASSTYGGWDDFEDEIVGGNNAIELDGLGAFIVDGGQYGHVDVFARPDGSFVLVNAESAQDEPEPDVVAFAKQPFVESGDVELETLGELAIPSGKLAIGLANNRLPAEPGKELVVVVVTAKRFVVTAEEGESGWRVEESRRRDPPEVVAGAAALDPGDPGSSPCGPSSSPFSPIPAWHMACSIDGRAMRRLRFLLLLTGLLLVGCATSTTPDDGDDEGADVSQGVPGTTAIGYGVAYRATGDGPGVFIAYGGYSVQNAWACDWAFALHDAKLRALGVGHVYCVQGPRDVGYAAKEIKNSALLRHLVAGPGSAAPFVFVAAHSSGCYVAHELFGMLGGSDAAKALRSKIVYADLDGAGNGLTAEMVHDFRRVAFVWAHDSSLAAGDSANAAGMRSLAAQYKTSAIVVDAARSGCDSGAEWCLHDTLVTTRPHLTTTYDLAHDYTDFVSRPVQASFVDSLAADLAQR